MILPDHAARADLGGVQLERGEFVAAIDAFRAADMQLDATYVAERVLTPEELKAYVDDQFPWSELDETESADPEIVRSTNRAAHPEALEWRWMLARRLIRGRRYEEARPYLPALVRPTLDKYVSALHQAEDATQPKAKRARAWFEAAILARHDGFEMMSTRAEPDGEFYSGSFPMEHIAGERAASGEKPPPARSPLSVSLPRHRALPRLLQTPPRQHAGTGRRVEHCRELAQGPRSRSCRPIPPTPRAPCLEHQDR